MFFLSNFNEVKTKELKKVVGKHIDNVYILIRLFDFITPIKVNIDTDKISLASDTVNIDVNKMRVHYFFTEDLSVMRSFLINTELELRLTIGINWNNPIALSTAFAF